MNDGINESVSKTDATGESSNEVLNESSSEVSNESSIESSNGYSNEYSDESQNGAPKNGGEKRPKNRLFGKNAKYGVGSLVMTVVAVAVVISVNLLASMFDLSIDLTANKMYTIGDVTREILADVNQRVEIIALFDENRYPSAQYPEIGDAMHMLENYTDNANIEMRFVDPDKNPGTIAELDPDGTLGVTQGMFLVRSAPADGAAAKSKVIALQDLLETAYDQQTYEPYVAGLRTEEAFSGAIKYVTSVETPAVYFISGHGELEVDTHYTILQNFLNNNNYLTETLNISEHGEVPDDAELLVFANPAQDIFVQELDILEAYFDRGGKAMFLFDFNERGSDLPNFNRLFSEFNLALNNDKVRSDDPGAHMIDDPYTIGYEVLANAVFPGNALVVLGNSRSVSILNNQNDNLTHTSIVSTTELATSEPVSADGVERSGPQNIAVAVENRGGAEDSRIVVIGNATFVTDVASNIYGTYYTSGMNMFLYSMMWTIGEQDGPIIEAKYYEAPTIAITEENGRIVRIGLMVVLPLIILGVGFWIYAKRRRL